MSGFAIRSSHQTKIPRAASPAATSARVTVPVQPRLGASMMASTMATRAVATGLGGLGHRRQHAGQRERDERDVDEEDAAPPEVREQQAAERRADHDA